MELRRDEPIRVLLAESHPLWRIAVSRALDSEEELSVVAEVKNGSQAMAEAARSRPDVIVLSSGLPGCRIETTRRLMEESQDRRVIVISDGDDEATLDQAVAAGASGYLSRESSLSDLIEATKAVCRGETMIPAHMLGGLLARLMRSRRERDEALEKVNQLSPQEQVVLELLAEGHSNNGIADQLTISPATARTHVQRILAKLDVHSRLEAAAYVRQSAVGQA